MATHRIMAPRQMPRPVRSRSARRNTLTSSLAHASRHTTVVAVRWGLMATCVYLLLAADTAAVDWLLGIAVIMMLAASNVALARLRPEAIEDVWLSVGIATADAVLMVGAWYASAAESFTPVIVSLGLLNLALVGVSLGEIAAIAAAAFIIYSAIGQVD